MSELDKTIEELEAEVQSELEEAAQDAPKKGAAKGESMCASSGRRRAQSYSRRSRICPVSSEKDGKDKDDEKKAAEIKLPLGAKLPTRN